MTANVIERMVRAATLAPSLHNSQPWRFIASGNRLDLFADRARSLRVVDPDGRWMTLSCGAALLNATVTARAAGRACSVRLIGMSDGTDRLATLELGGWVAPADEDVRLARAVPRRHTHRAPFGPRRLAPSTVDDLRRAAATEGCWSHTIDARAEVGELTAILRRAEVEQRADRAYRDELRAWVRELGTTAPDGVPAQALPPGGPDRAASDVWQRDFSPDAVGRPGTTAEPPAYVERPLVMLLGSSADDRTAWLRAGMATERVLLAATAGGAAASPLTQVLDLPAYRDELAALVGIDGRPHMLLRLGYPAVAEHIVAPRRDIGDVLRVVAE
jgi:nitroreductase